MTAERTDKTPEPAKPLSLAGSWAVIAGLLLLLPVFCLGLKDIRLKNDVESWLPSDDPNAIALAWYHDQFDAYDSMLVSWDTSSLADPRVEAFAAAVRNVPGVVSAATPQMLLNRMRESRIPDEVAAERLRGILLGSGGVDVRLTGLGRDRRDAIAESLRTEAAEATGLRLSVDVVGGDDGGPDLRLTWPNASADTDATRAVLAYLDAMTADRGDKRAPLIERATFTGGSPAAIAISVDSEAVKSRSQMLDEIRGAALSVGVPEDEFRAAGSPVAGSGLNQAVLKSAWNRDVPIWQVWRRSPVLLSGVLGVVLAYVMLRSLRLATLVLTVSIYTVIATLSLVAPTGGSMSMVLVVMPNLLLVLTMSGAIHLANYWKHSAHEGPRAAVARAVQLARTPCVMASFTTAVGLASLMTSVLTPVRDFGFYSALGCGISLFMILVGMAALLRVWPGTVGTRAKEDQRWWADFGRWLVRHSKAVSLACLAAFACGLFGLRYFKTETKVIRYFPDDSRIVADYGFLEENLAGIVPVTVLVGFQGDGWRPSDLQRQIQIVRSVEGAMADHPEVSGTLSLADFVPVPEDGVRGRAVLTRKIAAAVEKAVEGGAGSEFITRPERPLVLSAGQPPVFDVRQPDEEGDVRLGGEVWKVTAQVSLLSELDYAVFLDEVDALLAEVRAGVDVGDDRQVTTLVTGTVPLFLRTQEAVLESLIRSFGLAFVLIACVMMTVLRSVRAGLLTMLPNLLPVAVVFGGVSIAGIAVDIGTMITASVALGVAVDGTLHMLTWFREETRAGSTRGEAIAVALSHCGPAMWQTSAAVGLGMFALMGAELLLVSRFGWLMAALIFTALIADLVFLPALLNGTLGRLIERRVPRDDAEEPATAEASETPVAAT